jgi:hypothetical protein
MENSRIHEAVYWSVDASGADCLFPRHRKNRTPIEKERIDIGTNNVALVLYISDINGSAGTEYEALCAPNMYRYKANKLKAISAAQRTVFLATGSYPPQAKARWR